MPENGVPAHLSAEMKDYYAVIVREYSLLPGDYMILQTACEALDRANQASRKVKKDGAVFTDRFGQYKAHPSVGIERDNRALFSRLLQTLNLDFEARGPIGRPGKPIGGA